VGVLNAYLPPFTKTFLKRLEIKNVTNAVHKTFKLNAKFSKRPTFTFIKRFNVLHNYSNVQQGYGVSQ